jgi:hypothetical protein
MSALFDLYKLDLQGTVKWLGSVHTFNMALFEVELTAARAPGDYTVINRQTGERTDLTFGVRLAGHDSHFLGSVRKVTCPSTYRINPPGTHNHSSG